MIAPSPSLRRAVAVDLRLNASRIMVTLVVAGIALALVPLMGDGFTGLAPVWAALAWYRYGRADTIERLELVAGLGISRADRLRGRVVLIALESAALLTVSTAGALIALAGGDDGIEVGPTFRFSAGPDTSAAWPVLAGTIASVIVLLVTAIAVGKECLSRRPGRAMIVLTLVVHLAAALLVSFVAGIPFIAALDSGAAWFVSMPFYLLSQLAVAAALAVLLGRRVSRWVRDLDADPRRVAAR